MSNSQALIAFSSVESPFNILERWPDLELLDGPVTLASYESALDWCDSRDAYCSGPAFHTAKLIYRDGDWCVLVDFSMLMMADGAALANLSEHQGTVLVAMTQGTAGCASFAKYNGGHLVRSIDYVDGVVTVSGSPTAEEATVDLDRFYDTGLEIVWRAHNLSGLLFTATMHDIACAHYLDRGEMQLAQNVGPHSLEEPKTPKARGRPWWRIW